ncbi:carbohydrate kinase [Alicycliphilus sp. B1]|nr:carbohydrate kinase [Alicycliphilus sp. B1]
MLRRFDALAPAASGAVVCGCGGGAAVAAVLPQVLREARRLVLDADALNAIAADPQLQRQLLRERALRPESATVLTPHPLEAARLLACDTAAVQADRLAAARALADRFGCTALLKGSGSVVATPGQPPRINPTGNALLATGGTGDVLAGLAGAPPGRRPPRPMPRPHSTPPATPAGCTAPRRTNGPGARALTASALAQALGRA